MDCASDSKRYDVEDSIYACNRHTIARMLAAPTDDDIEESSDDEEEM